jgi:hypothetical protein
VCIVTFLTLQKQKKKKCTYEAVGSRVKTAPMQKKPPTTSQLVAQASAKWFLLSLHTRTHTIHTLAYGCENASDETPGRLAHTLLMEHLAKSRTNPWQTPSTKKIKN